MDGFLEGGDETEGTDEGLLVGSEDIEDGL